MNRMTLMAVALCATSLGAQGTLDEYAYTAPTGWTTQRYPDGIVLSATGNNNERCLLQIWPTRPAGPNLQSDAQAVYQEVFKTYQFVNVSDNGNTLGPTVIRGTSGHGWDYLILKDGIRKPPMGSQRFMTLYGFVFVAKLQGRLGVISGMSKEPLVSACFGESLRNVWPEFFYNLNFKSWTATPDPALLAKPLVGVWTTATATVADQWVFTDNGRYGGASAVQNYSGLSNGTVLETTRAYFGDGAYTLNGNLMHLTPDNKGKNPQVALVRVEEENGAPILYIMRKSSVDGAVYEVRYKKQR
ncbi:MAG TPA: hypothetical protein VK807_14480 [Gemmatimonadaceae bacterium]|nr:hypothetical protein [Gemmatimonadaceae bacterium]